ncbi:hypothetical protein N9O21_05885 [Rhodobacteraceae bacterium]|nr:hypothetical protein [Paracoccaceae bacterium]
MAHTNTDFAAFQQMRRINPSKYHNQKTRKTMNTTYRDMGFSEFFGIDTDDPTPVTEAEGTMDLPELTDTTLGCLYATGGLPIHRAAANGEAHKIFAAMICTMWSDNIQLAVDHNASTAFNKFGIFQFLSMAEAQNIIEWVGSTDEDSHPVYYFTPVTEYMLAQAYHPYADAAEECDDDDR